jgi:integrase
MPKQAKELSAIEVKRINTPGLHAVGGVAGLHLQVTHNGAATWILRIKVGNFRRDIGLGGYPTVTLAEAREKARRYREKVDEGIDPVAERRAQKAQLINEQLSQITFDEAKEKYVEKKRQELKNPKNAEQWRNSLTYYASPYIGNMRVDDIEVRHIIYLLEKIWYEKTETAKRVRNRIERILDWATVQGYRSGHNPARWHGNISEVLPQPSKTNKPKHRTALPVDHAPWLYSELQTHEGVSQYALQFLLLTALRSIEVRGARWEEFDFTNDIWIIPADRMKADKPHEVPLTPQTKSILHTMWEATNGPVVFPAQNGNILSDNALSKCLRTLNIPTTVHGLRSTFRDWAARYTNFPNEIIEKSLAHEIGDETERSYLRTTMIERRRSLMKEWEQFCLGLKNSRSAETLPE